MINLFEKKITPNYEIVRNIIEQYMTSLSNRTDKPKIANINLKVKQLFNEIRYCNHNEEQLLDFKGTINDFFEKYIKYLDAQKSDFQSNFIDTYGESVFELVMADFVHKKFSLNERTDDIKIKGNLPDLCFTFNGNEYLMECTTRDSFLVKDYIEDLDNFNTYIDIAKVFYDANLRDLEKGYTRGEWWFVPVNSFHNMEKEERLYIEEKLGFKNFTGWATADDKLKIFLTWLDNTRQILTGFNKILPINTLEKLASVGLSERVGVSWDGEDQEIFNKILAKFIAQCLLSKLGKKYFSYDKPVIISISLSLLVDLKIISDANLMIANIYRYLPMAIQDLLESKKENGSYKYNINIINKAMKFLYAIIIDTTHYNWFSNIPKNGIPVEYNNCYGVIYNAYFSKDINSEARIFDDIIPYQYEIDLCFEEAQVESEG